MTDVFIDQRFVGSVENPKVFAKKVREERQKGKISGTVNLAYKPELNEIHVETSKGRVRRPLIIVENGKSKFTAEHIKKIEKNEMTWKDLIKEGIIEYIDAAEEEGAYVALSETDISPEHTHMEISPTTILGLTTSLVPFANYGQSSRLNRGSKAQKQALGFYTANYLQRMDTDVNLLHYPQNPIVRSFTYEMSAQHRHPAGQNIIIALMSYEGYNMQDAIVLNQGSIQRSLARSTYFRPYNAEELRYSGGLVDEIGIPNKEVKGYRAEHDYRLLEDDGLIHPEATVGEDDVIIGKTSPPRFLGELDEFSIAANKRRESSITTKNNEVGKVDAVVITDNEEGNKLIQVRVRHLRIPEIGDKFASRHGQKGVVGIIVPEADMPFTASGIVPDLIFSPHSIPSRMTISHLIEIVAGKAGALSGRTIDGSAFASESEKDLRKSLVEMGFRENGTETMYSGVTGERLKVKIYVGNMYYLRLKHMVANKLHARASGRIQLLTRQPIEGRAKGGGLRLGEMEKDCLVAHGASLLLKERFDSDKTTIHVCEECGMLAVYDDFRNNRFCHRCGSNVIINVVEISYAFKLLLDELKALGIAPRLKLRNKY
ncbi:DNA-directed RNA polymerase subunit B [Candidatus Woesearchaeota archaeon]|nr:DNA-directed RNA polymerase subunit B [Candidatus Woesearchaeota archaeon]